jgi:outer membrane protein assembly factor BamD (BamD/ComL family)
MQTEACGMRASAFKTWCLLAWSLLALAGCRSVNADPATSGTVVPAAATASGATASGQAPPGGAQARFQNPAPVDRAEAPETPSNKPPPGVSVKDGPKKDDDDDDQKDWLDRLSYYTPPKIYKRTKNKLGLGPDESLARKYYAEAEELYRQQKYAEAAKLYKRAYKRGEDSPVEEDAMYMAAESFFFSDQYYYASDTYAMLMKKFENTRHMDKVETRFFAIARYWEDQATKHSEFAPNFFDDTRPYFDPRGNAIAIYEAVRLHDPTGPLADDALFATANAYFLGCRWDDADYNYDLIRKEYPRSEHQREAHLLGIRAKLRSYQGAEYDERPLLEADKLIGVTLAQWVSDLPEERERLQRAQRTIRAQKAERDWANAEYYYHRKYYRAARFYYAEILKTWPDTHFAEMSAERMEETKNLPPIPPN